MLALALFLSQVQDRGFTETIKRDLMAIGRELCFDETACARAGSSTGTAKMYRRNSCEVTFGSKSGHLVRFVDFEFLDGLPSAELYDEQRAQAEGKETAKTVLLTKARRLAERFGCVGWAPALFAVRQSSRFQDIPAGKPMATVTLVEPGQKNNFPYRNELTVCFDPATDRVVYFLLVKNVALPVGGLALDKQRLLATIQADIKKNHSPLRKDPTLDGLKYEPGGFVSNLDFLKSWPDSPCESKPSWLVLRPGGGIQWVVNDSADSVLFSRHG